MIWILGTSCGKNIYNQIPTSPQTEHYAIDGLNVNIKERHSIAHLHNSAGREVFTEEDTKGKILKRKY